MRVIMPFRARCVLLCLLLLIGLTGPARAADAIGTVIAASGAASATGHAGSRAIKAGSDLFENDRITVTSGNAQILFADGTKLVIGPNSMLLIDRMRMRNGTNAAQRLALKTLRGTFRFISGQTPKSAISITTTHATIGIRGTAFDFWVRAKTGVVVLNGEVAMLGRRGGKPIVMPRGCTMGVATLTATTLLQGREKRDTIKKNLPFLSNQSKLRPAFRLDVSSCRLK